MKIFNDKFFDPFFYRRERARWAYAQTKEQARVYYGSCFSDAKDPVVSGGIVKVRDLQRIYPNTEDKPNLFYYVSSAPPGRLSIIRRFAKASRAPIILNQNGVAYKAWLPEGWVKINESLRDGLHQASFVIYQSAFAKMACDHFLGSVSPAIPWTILTNPVDTSVFVRGANKASDSKNWRLIVAGSHSQSYRVLVPLQALACLIKRGIKASLTIAGRFCWHGSLTDVANDELRQAIESLGLRAYVTIKGSYTQAEAIKMYQDADILLHAKYNDNCPRMVIEAMASGLPVVYSASGGMPELVPVGAGVGIPAPLDWESAHPPDPAAMANAVEEVINDYNNFSLNARLNAENNFRLEPWLEAHGRIFNQLLNP